jgi:hypothetical protein
MSGLIKPTTTDLADAILQCHEHEGLLRAIYGEGLGVSPLALQTAIQGFRKVLVSGFPNSNASKEIAIITTLLANMLAECLMGIERASPITDAGRDGRVSAAKTFFDDALTQAVAARVFKPN